MNRLFKYFKPYLGAMGVVLLLVFLQSFADLRLPSLMSKIVDRGIATGDLPFIWRTGGLMLLVAVGGIVSTIGANFFSSRLALGLGRDLRSRLFSRVENFSLREFDEIGTSTLITRTTNDVVQIQNFTIMAMRMMVMAPMMCIGGIIMAAAEDTGLSLIFVIVLPVLVLLVILIARMAIPLFRKMQAKVDRLNLVLRESLTGIRVIRSFNRMTSEKRRFEGANRDLAETALSAQRIIAGLIPLMMLIVNGTTIAVVWFGAHRVDAGHIQVGAMMAFLQYAMLILFSLIMASMMFVMYPRASVSAGRIADVLETEPEIRDPDRPEGTGASRGRVEFRDVGFRYPGAEEEAISGISFEAGPGEVTAIIGGTGSGKTTLISMIPRFYEASSGSVLVDGLDVRAMTQADLRSRIGFVPQKAILFSGSVADNIRYGKESATAEELGRAAETAQAMDFIDSMAGGFDAELVQGGANLSGGQKQRLAIARALVRTPEIYIFDDAFSALDFRTDARLRAALRKDTRDATVIIVAQRISTIMDADRIIVLDEGRIAGMGTHRELLDSSPVYREIAVSQLSEEELA